MDKVRPRALFFLGGARDAVLGSPEVLGLAASHYAEKHLP